MKRKCSSCGAKTSIQGVVYCWSCREKLPTATDSKGAVTRGIGQTAVMLSLLGAVAVTFWWALR